MYLLGIDLGTTGCKSIIFSVFGEIIAEKYIEYPLITIHEKYIEQDANLWWTLVTSSTKNALKEFSVKCEDIVALSISSQGISFVPVDKEGNVLSNVISWLDTRPEKQVGCILERFGYNEIFKKTGKRISPTYTLPKILWVKENMPDLYNKTHKFLMGLDFLTYKLTGRYVTDHSMASGTMLYNISEKAWDSDILCEYAIDKKTLPDINYLGSPVGKIKPEAAEEMGLPLETLVVLGAQDQKCAAIGAGIKEGVCTVSLGTATAISTIHGNAVFDKMMRIPCFTFDEKRWVLESVIATSGVSLKWMKNSLFKDKTYSEIDEMVSKASPGCGSLYFYPHLEGASSPYWDSGARGFIYGISLTTTTEDLLRALFEGIAYQIRVNVELHEQIDLEINEIRTFGGGSKSAMWCQIIADITGKEVKTLYTSETANLGAAIIAGIGYGVFKNYEEAMNRINLFNTSFKPNPDNKSTYDRHFLKYKELQDRMLIGVEHQSKELNDGVMNNG